MAGQFLLISTVMVWSGSTGLYLERLHRLHALERSVPVRQPSLVKFVPVSGPSETSPVAGRPQLGQKLLAPDISLLLADGFINPNYEDYCLAQICVSQAGRLPKCPFSLANYRVRWGTARQ